MHRDDENRGRLTAYCTKMMRMNIEIELESMIDSFILRAELDIGLVVIN